MATFHNERCYFCGKFLPAARDMEEDMATFGQTDGGLLELAIIREAQVDHVCRMEGREDEIIAERYSAYLDSKHGRNLALWIEEALVTRQKNGQATGKAIGRYEERAIYIPAYVALAASTVARLMIGATVRATRRAIGARNARSTGRSGTLQSPATRGDIAMGINLKLQDFPYGRRFHIAAKLLHNREPINAYDRRDHIEQLTDFGRAVVHAVDDTTGVDHLNVGVYDVHVCPAGAFDADSVYEDALNAVRTVVLDFGDDLEVTTLPPYNPFGGKSRAQHP